MWARARARAQASAKWVAGQVIWLSAGLRGARTFQSGLAKPGKPVERRGGWTGANGQGARVFWFSELNDGVFYHLRFCVFGHFPRQLAGIHRRGRFKKTVGQFADNSSSTSRGESQTTPARRGQRSNGEGKGFHKHLSSSLLVSMGVGRGSLICGQLQPVRVLRVINL